MDNVVSQLQAWCLGGRRIDGQLVEEVVESEIAKMKARCNVSARDWQ